ncbi:hypothetical protein [Caldivirga sp.]|uniref:hypothetical protein n=1 Tax=Caldivirga sp. TaxID=2080243 RepID=UPI0025C3BAF6|nr:hypothetical protein [Caldivirga sp.]
MQCSNELFNVLESLLNLMCNGVEVNEALKTALSSIGNKQCGSIVSDTVNRILRGEVDALNEPLLNNYLLYLRPRISRELKGTLTIILNMVNEDNINEALSYLMSNACNLVDYDRVYAIDLARLMTLAKYDKNIINAIKCRINLILHASFA